VSNPFAIAAVTATLSQLLLGVREEPTLAGTTITVGPPDKARPAASTGRQLNLYLYEVVPNLGWRNMDLPQRKPGGQLATRPVLALNLRYLLTAYGEGDDDTDAQHVLAHAMSIVHDQGGLTRQQVRDAIQAAPALAGSDLADQIELIKLTPYGATLEDISRLWALYQSTNYRLSVGYEAAVVLIERPLTLPPPQPPVETVELFTVPLGWTP
jgi:hypothetical protein